MLKREMNTGTKTLQKRSILKQCKRTGNFRIVQLHKTEPCSEWEFPVKLRNYSIKWYRYVRETSVFSSPNHCERQQTDWMILTQLWPKKKNISRLGATVNASGSILNDQWVYVILETPRISNYTTISLKWSTSRGHSKNNGSSQYLTPFTSTSLVTCATFCSLLALVFNIIHETSKFFHLGQMCDIVALLL